MGTWMGVIVDTRGRDDFWELARGHGVEKSPERGRAPAHALIDCGVSDAARPRALAEALSKELGTFALGFVARTPDGMHELHAFDGGVCVRRLATSRGHRGDWVAEGAPQPWEEAYFSDDPKTAPMFRLCAFFELSPERPDGLWKPKSLWARLFGK